MFERPTIFALSSGRPPAAIAVIRISGSRAGAALEALGVKIPPPRKAALARIRDSDNEIIDEALALWFPGPNSETGEDTAELQLHGGRAVIAATLDALGRVEGLRPAEAGEFTRRAFENGKLDLTAVEGLADLVAAETQGQRRQAFRQMKGLLGGRAETWRQRLIQALALVEAGIDFSDEGDVQEGAHDNLVGPAVAIAQELRDEIAMALADGGRGERLREGLVVAIAGPPNAGKSTLLNRLAQREAAIVSPYAGTTRDVIEVHLELGGMPVTLLDTAGIRETDDPVELEGVRRARERAASADLVLWVVDASAARPMADADEPAAAPGSIFADRGYRFDDRAAAVETRRLGSTPSGGETAGAEAAAAGRISTAMLDSSNGSEAVASDTGGNLVGVAPAGSEPGPPQPVIWLIRNKIDLVQEVSDKSERELRSLEKNEHKIYFNNPLVSMVNSDLTAKSEPNVRSNSPLRNMVTAGLTTKTEPNFSEMAFDISATAGAEFNVLIHALRKYASDVLAGAEQALVTRARHRHALEESLAALRRALEPGVAGREDVLAEELRLAARALGRLTGRVDVEDILDVIFRDFCIGK